MTDTNDELILPPTLAETKTAMSALIGDVTELRTWLKLQFEGRRNGLWVDWDRVRETNDEVAALQGDIDALKKHASGFREQEARILAEKTIEKQALKKANLERQAAIQREAIALKNDKKIANIERTQRRENAAKVALLRYIAEHLPDHLATAHAVCKAAQDSVP